MKQANGYGSITKMKDKPRRKPWRVRITTGWSFDEATMTTKQIVKDLGYYATRQDAIKALADFNDHPFDLDLRLVTFGECYEQVKKEFTDGRKRNYYAAYKYLLPIKDKPIRQIKVYDMQRCIDACTTTQQGEIKIVCHKVYEYALRNEITDRNPSQYLKSNSVEHKKKEIFTSEQIRNIELYDTWWSKVTMMLLYSGMRTKELRQLTPEQINIDEAYIDIRVAKNRSSVRQIPIHSNVLSVFADYKGCGCDLYGCTHDGLNKALKQFCGLTAHCCRHTFTSRMHECGCNPLVLQLLLGHTPQSITEKVYTHISLKELRDNLELLDYCINSDTK